MSLGKRKAGVRWGGSSQGIVPQGFVPSGKQVFKKMLRFVWYKRLKKSLLFGGEACKRRERIWLSFFVEMPRESYTYPGWSSGTTTLGNLGIGGIRRNQDLGIIKSNWLILQLKRLRPRKEKSHIQSHRRNLTVKPHFLMSSPAVFHPLFL